jgi:hypothetical protein
MAARNASAMSRTSPILAPAWLDGLGHAKGCDKEFIERNTAVQRYSPSLFQKSFIKALDGTRNVR